MTPKALSAAAAVAALMLSLPAAPAPREAIRSRIA